MVVTLVMVPLTVGAFWLSFQHSHVKCSYDDYFHISHWLLGFAISTSIALGLTYVIVLLYLILSRCNTDWDSFAHVMVIPCIVWLLYSYFLWIYAGFGVIVVFDEALDCKDAEPFLWGFSLVISLVLDLIVVLSFIFTCYACCCACANGSSSNNTSRTSSINYDDIISLPLACAAHASHAHTGHHWGR